MFAGPNGSGKTTILQSISERYDIGYYVNADEIEQTLKKQDYLDLNDFGIKGLEEDQFNTSIQQHSIFTKAKTDGYTIDLHLKGNKVINPNKETHSYEAALLADIIREELLQAGKKFTFETVMSHASKVDFLKKAGQHGY